MPKSESIAKLTEALSKAQIAFLPIKRTEKVDFQTTKGRRKYNYAPLEAVIEATRKGLSDNGLAIIQTLKLVGENTVLETLLSHSSDEWISGEAYVGKQDQDPQSEGSALTYKRRYGMSAILCLASEEDDDAEGTEKKPESNEKPFDKTTHFCVIHKTPFFLKGKMKSYAHPIGDTEEWCHEHADIVQAEKEIDDFYPVQPAIPIETAPINVGQARDSITVPAGSSSPKTETKPPSDRETWVKEALPKAQWPVKDVAGWITGTLKVSVPKGTKLFDVIDKLSPDDWTTLEKEINSRIEAAGGSK